MAIYKRREAPPATSSKGWYAQWQKCDRCHHIQHNHRHYRAAGSSAVPAYPAKRKGTPTSFGLFDGDGLMCIGASDSFSTYQDAAGTIITIGQLYTPSGDDDWPFKEDDLP